MRVFANVNPASMNEAVAALRNARANGRRAVVTGGGSDLLGLIKERLVMPDVLVNLKTIPGLDRVVREGSAVRIGGLITLDALSRDSVLSSAFPRSWRRPRVSARRRLGIPAPSPATSVQRPWCWYLRNGFPCYKNGGDNVFRPRRREPVHAIFGAVRATSSIPSDTAPALVALDAASGSSGPAANARSRAADFFVMPATDPARENMLTEDEILAEITLPTAHRPAAQHLPEDPGPRGMDPRPGQRGDRARYGRESAGRRASCSAEWRRFRSIGLRPRGFSRATDHGRGRDEGGAGAVADARPLSKNAYKVALTRAVIRRTLLALAERPSGGNG